MRRRRQRNPLLMRIIGISILLHVIALPVLAHFGAFKKIQHHFIETRLVNLPPPTPVKDKQEAKKPQHIAHKPSPVARKAASTSPHQQQAAQKSNLNQPKVVASAGDNGPGGSGAPTVAANGTGKAGELPTQQTDTTPPTVKASPPPPVKQEPAPPKQEAPPVKVAQAPPKPLPTPPPVAPAPEPKPTAPVFTAALATYQPQPAIPDDLRSEALDRSLVVEMTVSPDGAPTSIQVAQSTGVDELDRVGLDAAKQWKFKPATRDGQPVESHVRLHIEYQVN